MELVRLEGSTPNEDTIETVLKHSESVPGARLFAATALANLGQNDQAEQILEVSIDRGLAPTASRRLLAAFLAGKHPWQFGELVRSVIVNERESLLESASLTALSPSPNLISTFADPMAKTELRFSRGYLNNSLEFTAPSRLLKSGDDVAQVALGLPDKSVPGELDTSTVDTVHATFPYDIPDGLQKLSVPVMVKLPTINAEFLFQGTVTAERDQSWTTSVLDAASAAAGPISQNASSLIWGKSSSPTAEHSAANDKIPTVPIWHFSLRTIKGEGFCYASVDGALAACPID